MGTYVTIVVYSLDKGKAEASIDAAFNRIDEIEKIASVYDEKSEVSRLNREGYIDNPSPELVELINLSIKYYELTNGCFDITVQPVLKLWEEGLWKEDPDVQAEKIEEALKLVGSDKIRLDKNRIELETGGMAITLGGIAAGYAVDEALKTMQGMGITSALINLGGDIKVIGLKPGEEKWFIALENPDNRTQKIAEFELSDKAITTSGNYERYFNPEKTAHHIIDPRSGFSANECISATVIADSCVEADALATGVFVMGPKEGLGLVESLDGVEALIIDQDRNIYKSSRLYKYLSE
ncbi:MAG: FAD:protein FMN transferase [Actinobacteria bacterium]|nr:FAD:protein FMN transferase [Actinomycetota bacterium]